MIVNVSRGGIVIKVEELQIAAQALLLIEKSGVSVLYPPQEDAINAGALRGQNLVLASPTASGKTLVAELCALKHILEREGKVLYLTPLRALASEKYDEFRKYVKLTKPNGQPLSVAISTGDYDHADSRLGRYDIIIVTNEKCDSLLRHKADWIDQVSLVVADEIHLLNDAHRGPTLEVTLTRLMELNPNIQMLALSATIRNAEEIAEWLKATSILTEWRPVKLLEGVHLKGECQFNNGSSINIDTETSKNAALNLAAQVITQRGQSLIFAETRARAVSYAKRAAPLIRTLLSKSEQRVLKLIAKKVANSGEKTRINDLQASLVERGVAFHHAGLSASLRKIVEDAFKRRQIKLISATPTLAAGVNLPARRVIISSYERYESGYGRYPITVLEYKQMAGRAGRPKYDIVGEAILLARTNDEQDYLMESYVFAKPERIWSKLAVERVLRTHVLASIATGFVRSEQGLYDFFGKTFCANQYGSEMIQPLVGKALLFLHKENMINLGRNLDATSFGHRVSELYLDPISAVMLRDSLQKRANHLTDFSLLHMVCHTPNVYPKTYPRRRESEVLATVVDTHSDEFTVRLPEMWDNVEYGTFLGEVKAACVLEEWIRETSEDAIIERFSVLPGDLFRLVDSVDWLLYASTEIGRLFNHRDLLPQLRTLRNRVNKGVKLELLPMVQLRGIGRVRGRVLFNAGFASIRDLKLASIEQLTTLPTIGPQIAKRIKEQVGGKVQAEAWAKLKSKQQREQASIAEY
jgi:helicase